MNTRYGVLENIDMDSFVTFSDINFSTSFVDEMEEVHKQRSQPENVSQNIHESIPLHSYSFNPDIYRVSALMLPKNVLRLIPQEKKLKDISVPYHMPDWKLYEFTSAQQREFILKYFKDYIELYDKHPKIRSNLFVYLWMYANGGIYISPNYELTKPLDSIFSKVQYADLYFMFDSDTYVSTDFFASQPFCNFWMEAIDHMEKQTNAFAHILKTTQYKFEIIPRIELDPYNMCDTEYEKDTYLFPINREQDFMTYMSCQTGSTTDELYLAGIIIITVMLMFIIAMITN